MIHPVTKAIFRRDLKRWFGNPAGYVFLTLFVLLATLAQFGPHEFYVRNLATLDTLNEWFPLLLLFFVPAITMSIWAGEKTLGTDELLLTLPARDVHIVAGKFLAAAGIYTISLLFTLPIVVFLAILGDPDWGLVLSNYLGYWLLGLALISVSMVGSLLTDNLTVAFILGALFTGAVIVFEPFLAAFFPELARSIEGYGPISQFRLMARGVVSLAGVLLFAGMTLSFLYLNLVLLGRRHWEVQPERGVHLTVRFVSLLLATLGLTMTGANAGARLDLTAERVHSLSDETVRIIESLPEDRTVFITAYVSPEVPTDYVPVRRTLLDLLDEYDALGGERIQVRVVDTEPFSKEAHEAETNYGIQPQNVVIEEAGRVRSEDIYLGLAFTCGTEEVVIPFLHKGLPIEYELTRSIRVVAQQERRKVGILDTDVRAMGGFDFQRGRSLPKWDIVNELELQYEVKKVAADEDYPDDLDALVVLMPSTLTQDQLDRLSMWIEGGHPTLLVDDPFPAEVPDLAPPEPKGGRPNPLQPNPSPEKKGDILGFLAKYGIEWVASRGFQPAPKIVWDAYNPFPQFDFDPEIVFVAPQANPRAFNPDESITSGLQQVVLIFGGAVRDAEKEGLKFTPLLRSSEISGFVDYNEMFRFDPFFGRSLNPRRPHRIQPGEKILACRVRGTPPGKEKAIDVVFLPDLDAISRQFFDIRRRGIQDLQFDNVTLLLNMVDVLAGDESFVELRKRRPRHRTLTLLEAKEKEYEDSWLEERRKAEEKAEADLAEARRRLDEKVKQIEQRTDLDEMSKAIQVESVRRVEQRRLDAREAEIEAQKERAIREAQRRKLEAENRIRNIYRIWAAVLAPIPAILVGFYTMSKRLRREREAAMLLARGGEG